MAASARNRVRVLISMTSADFFFSSSSDTHFFTLSSLGRRRRCFCSSLKQTLVSSSYQGCALSHPLSPALSFPSNHAHFLARTALGNLPILNFFGFVLAPFHSRFLSCGASPLDELERIMAET